MMKFIRFILTKITNKYYEYIIYPILKSKMNKYNVKSIETTIKSLINNNKSLSRFGDGEIRCVVNYDLHMKSKPCGFQSNDPRLSQALINVLESKDSNLEVGLPDIFRGYRQFTYKPSIFWRGTIAKVYKYFFKYLNHNKIYYNANFSRCYIDYKNKRISPKYFALTKKIWNNKKILIVEGKESRLGIGNDLFNNASEIKRIECPSTNAFSKYHSILVNTLNYLSDHKDYITLVALGPTATVLVSDIAKREYKAIDIGQIDLEYAWCQMGTHKRVDIPYKYVNEVNSGNKVIPVKDSKYNNEIVKTLK